MKSAAAIAAVFCWATSAFAQTFEAPLTPPHTRYVINARLDREGQLVGDGSIVVRNTGTHDLDVIQFQWSDPDSAPFEISLGGATREYAASPRPIEVALPQPLRPGAEVQVAFRFRRAVARLEDGWRLQRWFPRLWWGYETHAMYDVGIDTPPDVLVATSARRDVGTGRYRADHVRAFGLFLGRGFDVAELNAGPTLVRSIFRPNMRACATLVLETAADAIDYYRHRFGIYPQPSLTIVPGSPSPHGGFPFATAMVLVHGQEACEDKPRDAHWRWIAAHEVAHQYWLEHVLAKEAEQGFGWLMIGLGIWTDREYSRERNIEVHASLLAKYADAVRSGANTLIEIAPEELRKLAFDYNSVVTHYKGFGVISALAAVVGRETFERIHRRALREYAGLRLGAADFRRIAEAESGQDLGWFFVPLLRSNRFASYEAIDAAPTAGNDQRVVRVTVVSRGNLMLPIPVEARFANGTRERLVLDRMQEEQTLGFPARGSLRAIVIDPEHDFPLVIPAPEITAERLAELAAEMPWIGAGDKPMRFYRRAVELDAGSLNLWTKLALTLFGAGQYKEALDAFQRVGMHAAGKNANWQFGALVWRGMLNDLSGQRALAIDAYKAALALGGDAAIQHTQYGLLIDRAWVEQRLAAPFVWPRPR